MQGAMFTESGGVLENDGKRGLDSARMQNQDQWIKVVWRQIYPLYKEELFNNQSTVWEES